MSIPNKAGTPIKAILFGVPYEVMADCKPMSNFTGSKTEANATSGTTVFKETKQPKSIKGLDVKMSIQDYNLLCQMIDAVPTSVPCGLMYADKSVATGPGRIDLGDHDGAEGKASLDIYFDDLVVVAG